MFRFNLSHLCSRGDVIVVSIVAQNRSVCVVLLLRRLGALILCNMSRDDKRPCRRIGSGGFSLEQVSVNVNDRFIVLVGPR